jgi:hypothetical protein
MTSSPTPEPPDSPGSHEREAWSPSRGRDESFGGWHKVAAAHRYAELSSIIAARSLFRIRLLILVRDCRYKGFIL